MASAKFDAYWLNGVCKCGKTFNAYVKLPSVIQASDNDGHHHRIKLAEHVIVKCPYCNRLVNLGNGSKRASKMETD